MSEMFYFFLLSGGKVNMDLIGGLGSSNKHEFVFLLYPCEVFGLRITSLEGGQSGPELQLSLELSDLNQSVSMKLFLFCSIQFGASKCLTLRLNFEHHNKSQLSSV
ncbi:hypothetical protein AMECASPLE_030218 [Ameca splendens]|uniref:Uncharacterized protein n=1 Tax=Ameca splendens TaxID=208324 RepID=A0ABV0YT73_9TELE